jgi:hypothetical protein
VAAQFFQSNVFAKMVLILSRKNIQPIYIPRLMRKVFDPFLGVNENYMKIILESGN